MVIITDQLVTSRAVTSSGTNPCRYITVHETGNPALGADAQAHADLQSRGNSRSASWHIQVDDEVAIRSFPDEVRCWHAGDGTGPGNFESIALEVCVNSDGNYARALANAADVVRQLRAAHSIPASHVVQHHRWNQKHCPAKLRDSGGWAAFVASTDPSSASTASSGGGSTMSTFSSPVPARSRLTSNFGSRWGTLHAGTDYGPPVPGANVPVYACADGVVERVGRGNGGRTASVVPYHSGHAVRIDHGVHGGDRMRSYYGHLKSYSVRPGQRVRAGEYIGTMGGSGARTMSDFAVHLHFGVFQNILNPVGAATRRGAPGWINPHAWMGSKGITVGSTAPLTVSAPAPAASSSSSSSGTSSSSSGTGLKRPSRAGDHAVANNTIRSRLDTAGYRRRSYLRERIWQYQNAQLHSSLRADGHWGQVTDAWFEWTRSAQRALNRFRSSRAKLRIDGDYRAVTAAYVKDVQTRNGLHPDGDLGPVTIRFMRSQGASIPNRP